jgi:hypothetical protein
MNPAVFAAILDKLLADTTLTGLLGGAYIYRAYGAQPAHIPAITLIGNNETGSRRPGYNSTGRRDKSPTLQIDIWISTNQETAPCTGEDADEIADRIDEILYSSTPITGTHNWAQSSASVQDDSDIGGIHVTLRYSFKYGLTDTM